MTTISKSSVIRIKALGLHWRGSGLLAFEVYDRDGRLKGVRPLGGSVEFGETAKDAVVREFKEEIDTEVSVLAGPIVLENVFVHEGQRRHESCSFLIWPFLKGLSRAKNAFDSKRTMAPKWWQLGMIRESSISREGRSFTRRVSNLD